jgi:hypothetical protein
MPAMAKAIALIRSQEDRALEFARAAIVLGCGLALALAGTFLPL